MASENKTLKRGIELYIDGKPVLANMKQVETEAKKLKEAIRGMTVGSKEYFEATKRYQELNRVLQAHRNELKGIEKQQQSLLSKGIQFFKDYSLQIAGAVAALTGISMKINAFRKQAAEKEDAAANLKALTGLDDNDIQWLTQQAEKLSTTMEASGLRVRKAATEILEAYMLVGSAKPELLKDKQALNDVTIEAMRLAEAANMDLKEAVNAVTTSLNQYSAGADQAARFTNVLAAGSKFGAANVQDQAASVVKAGVAASSANVSFEQLVGVIEMLGEKGIKAEEAGTALKRFFLKLQTDADDTNPAIVGLDKALENLAAKQLSMGELQKMFGDRAINVAKILIDNTEKVKEYTEAVTGTSTAIEQAAINSDTAAAKMAQVRNQINLTGQELAKTLAPIISQTVGWTRKFVLALPPLIDYLKKYGLSTAALIATLVLYNTYTKIASTTTSAWSAVITFAKTQLTSFKAILLAYRTALTGSTTAQIEMTAAMKGTNIVTRLAAVAVGLLKAAYYALSLQMTPCVRTLKSLKAVLAESGVGLLVLAIGAAVSAIIRYNEKMKDARRQAEEQRKAEKALYKEYDEAAARIKRLRKVANDHTASLNDRRKAITELQKLAPDYQASISEEGKLIEKNTQKLDEYLERLKASIILEANKTKMSELLQKQAEAEEEQRRASDEYWKIAQQNTLHGYDRNSLPSKLSRLLGIEAEDKARKAMHKAEKELKGVNKEIDALEQRMKDTADKWGFSLVDETANGSNGNDNGDEEEETGGGSGSSGSGGSKETKKEKRIREELAAIDAEYNKKAADLKQQYIDGEIEKEEEYAAKVQVLEMERLEEKMKVAGLEPEKREEIRLKILEIKQKLVDELRQLDALEGSEEERKLNEQLEKNRKAAQDRLNILESAKAAELLSEEDYNKKKKAILDKQADDDKKAYEKMAENRLTISRKSLATALFQLRQQRASELMADKDYNTLVLEAKKRFYETMLQDQSLSNEQREQLQREYDETVLESVEKRNEEIADKNRQLFDVLKSAGEEVGEAFAELFSDSEEAYKDFMKSILKTLLDSIERMMVAYISKVTMESIATFGFGGLAAAAGKIALITAAFETAKAAIGGFEEGGFTPDGRKDEPQGIVHSNEFVANRFAVQNPQVLPVLQLIDAAQRSGSISNLTGSEIAAVASGFASTPHKTQTVSLPPAQPAHDAELAEAIRLLINTTKKAAEAYKEPVHAYTFADGRGGVNEAQELLDRMKRNASRKS